MKDRRPEPDPLLAQVKQLVADMFLLDAVEAEKILDHEPLLGGSLGLDSLDALELAMNIEEEFGITIGTHEESREAFTSIASLADFIRARRRSSPGHSRIPLPTGGRLKWV